MRISVRILWSAVLTICCINNNSIGQSRSSRNTANTRNQATTRATAANEYWGNTFALIIGISHYEDPTIDSLKFADADANNFYTFLNKKYGPKVDSNNIKKLINKEASSGAVTLALGDWLEKIKPRMKRGDVLFVYWSGHGLVDRDGQKFLCQNTIMPDLSNSDLVEAISVKDIKRQLKYFANSEGIKVYLIVDACRKKILSEDYNRNIDDDARTISGPGELYLYAASSDEVSYETKELQPGNGIFTYFLLLGLQGAADRNNDNKITFGELARYTSEHVSDYVQKFISKDVDNPEYQTPDIYTANPNFRNFVLTKVPPEVAKHFRKISDSISTLINAPASNNNIELVPKKVHSGNSYNKSPGNHHSPGLFFDRKRNGDTLVRKLYDSISVRINRKDLVTPPGNSAYDYLLALKKLPAGKELAADAQPRLYVALFDKVQVLIDSYLAGRLNKTDKAVFDLGYQELKCATTLTPNDSFLISGIQPKLNFLKARSLAGSNNPRDWNEALAILDTSLAKAPRASYLYHTKGIVYSNKGRFFSARKYFDSARAIAPNWIYALYSMAVNSYRMQEFGQSIDSCRKIIEKRPDFSRAYSLIALNRESIEDYQGATNYKDAIDWNMKAIQKDSSNTSAYLNLGRLYSKIKIDRAEAIVKAKYYYTLAAKQYNDENGYNMLGSFYFALGSQYYDSARLYFQQSLNINPFNPNTLGNYAYLMDVAGDIKGGASLLQSALVKSGYDYNVHTRYCQYVFITVSPDSADLIFQQIIQNNHEDPSVFINYSKLYENKGLIAKAKDILTLGLSYIRESPSLNYALAELYFQHQNKQLTGINARDSARKYLNVVNTLTPNYSLVNYAKYQFFETENKDSAAYYLRKATQLNAYIHGTKNFTKNAIALGDSAFIERKFNLAIGHYRLVKSVRAKDFYLSLALARSYYLVGQTDSALAEATRAYANIRTTEDELECTELLALIAFDQKKYQVAYRYFKELDYDLSFPDNIGQALTLFELHKYKQARTLYRAGKDNNPDAIEGYLHPGKPYYSENFLHELGRFLSNFK